eukprot:13602761-Alexandrium_andersonii.AAC.1
MELNASSDPSTATFGGSSEEGVAVATPALALGGPDGPVDEGGASSAGSDGVGTASMATAVSAVLSAISQQQGASAPAATAPAPVAVATGPETFALNAPPGETRE